MVKKEENICHMCVWHAFASNSLVTRESKAEGRKKENVNKKQKPKKQQILDRK